MYTNIFYIAQSYFHQDFPMEAETPIGVVEMFREKEAPETVEALRAEIVDLVASSPSEEDFSRIWFDDGAACYDPVADGMTMRDWMLKMAKTLNPDS